MPPKTPKTKIVDGERIDLSTGQPFADSGSQTSGGLPPELLNNLKQSLGGLSQLLQQRFGVSAPTAPPAQGGDIITSQSLAPQPDINLSNFQPSPSSAPGALGFFEAQAEQNKALIETQQKQAERAQEAQFKKAELAQNQQGQNDSFLKRLRGLFGESDVPTADSTAVEQGLSNIQETRQDIADVRGSRASLEEEAGIPELTQEFTDIQNQIEARQHALNREIEAISTEAGLTTGQANARIAEVKRRGASELADLSIIQNAKSRNLTTAQANVDRAIELKLEPLQEQLEFDKFFFEEAKEIFTKEEDRAFQQRIKNEERAFDFLKEELDTIYNTAVTAAQNGAPNQLVRQIQNAGSKEEALQLAGEFVGGADDLAGTSSDLQTFAAIRPDLKVGTPEFQTAFNQFVAQQAALKRKPGGGEADSGTQTERAISSAQTQLSASADPETGQVDLDTYFDVRAQTAINPSQFDDRFARIYLSEGDAQTLRQLTDENLITNEGLAS